MCTVNCVFNSDVERLKELQVDLTTQHRIAADLLSQVCKMFKFPYERQCVLDSVRVVAATINNLQKLEAALSHREDVSMKELQNLHVAVEDYVQCVKVEIRPWLSNVLPYVIDSRGYTELTELKVSLLVIIIITLCMCVLRLHCPTMAKNDIRTEYLNLVARLLAKCFQVQLWT